MIPEELFTLLATVCKGCGNLFDWGYSFCRYCEDRDTTQRCVCVPRQDEDEE